MKSTLQDWTTWEGGDCPVPAAAYVDITLRNGVICYSRVAGRYLWGRARVADKDVTTGGDIVAYRMAGEVA